MSTSSIPSADQGSEFQEAARRALETVGQPAAVVVLSVETPRVLAIAQSHYADAARLPLAPASTVKPLLYAAALDRGQLRAETTFDCHGHLPAQENWTCTGVHGRVDISRAIATSCNVFAWQSASQIGYPEVRAIYESWGFGSATGLADDEARGVVPPVVENEVDNRMMAFGHGRLRVTLLQLAVAYAELGRKLRQASDTLEPVRRGLIDAVEAEYGTARGARVDGLSVLGKTGSSPTGLGSDDDVWFVALAPAESPEVVVASYVLGGRSSNDAAVPIAVSLLSNWQASSQRR